MKTALSEKNEHKKTPASLPRAVNEVGGYSHARVPFRPRQLFQHPSACHRGRNKPRLQLGLGNAPPIVDVNCEPPLAMLSVVAPSLIHRTRQARGGLEP